MAYRIFRTAIGLILLVLIGCAQNPLALERVVADSDSNVLILEPSNEPSADSHPSAAPFTAIESEQNPAVLALIHQAERHWQDGNIQHAEVALERALRINPKDLKLYRLLAELKLESVTTKYARLMRAYFCSHESEYPRTLKCEGAIDSATRTIKLFTAKAI